MFTGAACNWRGATGARLRHLTDYRYEYDIAGVKHRIRHLSFKSEPQQETQREHHHDN